MGGSGVSAMIYLATPYRAYPGGLDAAALAAEKMAARLLDCGIEVYSPIAHSHNIAKHTRADQHSDFWLLRQKPFLRAAAGIVVGTLPGWEDSSGIKFERAWMEAAGKPEWLLAPSFNDLPKDLQP